MCMGKNKMETQAKMWIRQESLLGRIESLQGHIVNLHMIGGEGRLALALQFEEKVEILKQRAYELNLEIDKNYPK